MLNTFVPLRTYSLPSRTVVFRMLAASEPDVGSVNAYDVIKSPAASFGRYFFFWSSVPEIMIGSAPSSWTAMISAEDAHALATSSTTLT